MEEKRRKIGKVDVMKGRGGERRKGGCDDGKERRKERKMNEMKWRRREGR